MAKCGNLNNILVVDDDAIITELVKSSLDQSGFQTHIARSGRFALECIYNMHLNGMILDLILPDLDGFIVLSEMYNNNYIMKIPTLILSGNYALNNVKRAIHLGAKDYIAKPFNDKQLISRVMRLVHEQQGLSLGEDVIYI